jgi:site-specific DNA-methyltransferase (cytosine-N4-specific)
MLTKRQKEVLDFIKSYKKEKGYAPSLDDVKKYLKLSSVSTAHYHVKRLQEEGYLQKEYNQARSISTAKSKQSIEIPILGTIAAGQPIEAIEIPDETITVTKNEVGRFGKHYALRVAGSSMIDEGIFDGDIVVIRQEQTADNGQTVVAIINDNEATLKKLYREKDHFRLQPANPSLFPIYTDEVEVRGVVVKIIRNLESQIEKEKVADNKLSRRIDYSWDFKGVKTKPHTHIFHTYPAMFIPQVARRLLLTYTKKGDTICDIFCGSGTALVESRLVGRNSYGIDLNPLAIFLAKVKTTPIDPNRLSSDYLKLLDRIRKIKIDSTEIPKFKNIEFWFKEKVIIELTKIKKAINTIKDENTRNFFMVAFSEIVRKSSNSKNGEFKLVRIKGEKLENFNPNVLELFKQKVEANISGMSDFYNDVAKESWAKIILGDSSQDNGIKENSIDCVITSPPYGDSRTTVAYGQFSRLSAQWIDLFEEPNNASGVDNDLLGGKATKELKHKLSSKYLLETLDKISRKDEKRAREVLSFNIGLNECLKQSYKILKPKGYFCIVIGNRQVKQVRIPTDFIIAELAQEIGFTCEDIFVRNIPGKRMPIKNSPTNVTGELEETMTKESIVVLRKN